MSGKTYINVDFDLKLATECASVYSEVSGIGCTVSDAGGKVLFETGFGCASCGICETAGFGKENCIRAHAYGMTEAERFGGKYIYFCPMGLTCFVSPIMGQAASAAKITVGPFLMVGRDDYMEYDLKEKLGFDDAKANKIMEAVGPLPYILPAKVNSLSNLLFMAVGFMNKVSDANRMQEIQDSTSIQGHITQYIMELKSEDTPPEYPINKEKALIASIIDSDKPQAQKLLNELLGHILFSSGGDFASIKSRIYELLVIISRAAADAGTSPDLTFQINNSFFQKAASTSNIDELCLLLSDVTGRYIDSLFDFTDVKNADVISKAVHYMRKNRTEKVTLESAAKTVYLSSAYFSKIFKSEMGCSFNTYLNRLRIEKSKQFLRQTGLRLADVANMSGFEDQSYFTKVFKRVTGTSPNQYRKSGGRLQK